jgi:putative membrane protein
MLTQHLMQSFAGFDDFLIYLCISLALLGLFLAIYVRITPYHEIALIRDGNMAAAYSLSGTMLGFIVPLASAVEHSVNPVDMVVWGVIALLIQLFAFMLTRLLLPNITVDIPAGKQAPGFFLGAVSLGVGILNAASMTY